MAYKNYSLIEHTADIGIRVKAASLKGIFKKAAEAVFDISCQKINAAPGSPQVFSIVQEAADANELLVNWLNELLSLSQAKGVVFFSFEITKLDAGHIHAQARAYPATDYKTDKEIKAATYHGLKIQKKQGSWQAEIIFDV